MQPIAVPSPTILCFRKASARETAALLIVAGLIPFLVHLLPWSGERPLGAHLLPMFWATFVAAYFYGGWTALLVGMFAPALNLMITGLPAWKFLGVLSLELVVYAGVTTWAIRRLPRFVLVAPIGYVIAKLTALGLLIATGALGEIGAPLDFLVHSVRGGAAGLGVLALINTALVLFYSKRTVNPDDAS